MSLPAVRLDPRGYEELVSDARAQVRYACPELALDGAGDPALTLIELFGWMAGLAADRLARVPEKLHIELLRILGIELQGPAAARTEVRMRLSAPAERPVSILASTEIGTTRTAAEGSIVFQLDEDFLIAPLRPAAYVIERAGALKEIGVAAGVAYPHGPDRLPFAQPPAVGDALYLGFEAGIARLLVQVSMEASMARGAGVNPEDPPLRWEVSQGQGAWAPVEVLADGTGGFNYGSGTIELQCPPTSGVEALAGRRLHWLRCRIVETTRTHGGPAAYQYAPEIFEITAAPVGAQLPAEHSAVQIDEPLGISDGTPGQSFDLRFAPVLGLAAGETVEVQAESGDWERWDAVLSFADSGSHDPHFTIDLVNGRITFGPELRRQGGDAAQHGAVPPRGAAVRMARYRHGGGRRGNVEAGALVTLRSAIPGIASVTNPAPALGGVDPQSVDAARERAALQIRTRERAVTAEDYEFLAQQASPRVARARAAGAADGVTVTVLPRVNRAGRRLTIDELTPEASLLAQVERHLDARKLAGCTVRLAPARLRGVSVVVSLQASPRADRQRIEREVRDALYVYLNPLVGGPSARGWPFGRPLNQGELYAIVHGVPGVEFVRILRLYEVDFATGDRARQDAGRRITPAEDELIASGEHIVRVDG